MGSPPGADPPDLRLALVGLSAWAGALAGHAIARHLPDLAGGAILAPVAAVLAVAALLVRRTGTTWVLVTVVLGLVTLLRVDAATENAVADLAQQRARVTLEARVATDPVLRRGRHSDVLVYRVNVTRVLAPAPGRVRAQLVVLDDPDAERPAWGSTVRLHGRLSPADDGWTAAVMGLHRPPETVAGPSRAHRAAAVVRTSIRTAARGPDPGDRLVPALVDGDDAGLPAEVAADFRTAGLTHLTAVSGANLTILLAFLLPCARWLGVRAHGLLAVGALGIVGFVLVARPEPSVLRAAAMGTAALIGLGWGGRAAGARALGAAVLVLLLVSPRLAVAWGFALSVAATAGILVLAPPLRDAMGAYAPRWLAEAVSIPLAAQLACTPLVAVLSSQVSVVAVAANLAAAPLVGPTTILGLAGGFLALVWVPLGAAAGSAAGVCAQGIVLVARAASDLPGAAVPWPASGWPLVLLVLVCLGIAVTAPRVLRSRALTVLLSGALVLVLVRPELPAWMTPLAPGRDWPPEGWVVAMCDVGQGDALVLPVDTGRAVVVDAGPDADTVDRCLRRLGVREVPVLVLTHFHDDHVGGLRGVLHGRRVGEVLVSPLPEPAYGAEEVADALSGTGVPVRVPTVGESASLGQVRWQVLGPRYAFAGSPNDSSLVLLAEVAGTSILLPGDAEPVAQASLLGAWRLEPVDVLKVPHHGSRYQDEGLLRAASPAVALVGVGEDNDYGHPADATLDLIAATGAAVWRSDESGDVVAVPSPDGLVVVPRR